MLRGTIVVMLCSVLAGVKGISCPAGMEEVGALGCLALHREEYERMEWKDCREFCWETYFAHLGKLEES